MYLFFCLHHWLNNFCSPNCMFRRKIDSLILCEKCFVEGLKLIPEFSQFYWILRFVWRSFRRKLFGIIKIWSENWWMWGQKLTRFWVREIDLLIENLINHKSNLILFFSFQVSFFNHKTAFKRNFHQGLIKSYLREISLLKNFSIKHRLHKLWNITP